MSDADIRAAGGVVWRTDAQGERVALVHRPRYQDWSLPKGKLDSGESAIEAAVREVHEETGRSVAVGQRLPTIGYHVGERHKRVWYWAMRDLGQIGAQAAAPANEVDTIQWLRPAEAIRLLSYESDRQIISAFAAAATTSAVVVLLRHARAGRRSEWSGDDRLRPLDARGHEQASAVAQSLACFRPTALYTSQLTRCQQTLDPLARRLALTIELEPAVSDAAFAANPGEAVAAIRRIAATGQPAVVCSQGNAIPGLLQRLLPVDVRATVGCTHTRKAAFWAVGFTAAGAVWADRYDRQR